MESRPAQAVLPLVGLAAQKVSRDRYILQAVGFFRVESCPTQAVLPLVGLAAEKVIRDWYNYNLLVTPEGAATVRGVLNHPCVRAPFPA